MIWRVVKPVSHNAYTVRKTPEGHRSAIRFCFQLVRSHVEGSRLTDALSTLTNNYTENSLNANPSKTQVCAFHLNNHQANTKLEIIWNDQPLKYDEHPVYLGVTLYRTLSFSQHAMNVKAKVAARNSLLRKLANSNWGADPKTLRTAALALSYSRAEYSSAVWARSCHEKKVDAELNNACRIVTGQLRPTPLPLLYRTAGIAPPDIRRQTHRSTEKHKQEKDLRHPLFDHSYPRARLKKRTAEKRLGDPQQSKSKSWKDSQHTAQVETETQQRVPMWQPEPNNGPHPI
ncbi:RNA-directed DNA polymerase from mobile element jockey-like protein [Elysia marginata]|uniref:RNA-directed DNA polymerase from mobile element jockey-like protein n=1 Tax=Elysia marginata TaxID=1093978 RepID=A0AAV4JQC7_9GAST|nr:RNA-directed DNA polymerase from mobile element jockey-like protein [Elysia marginata]